MVIVYYVDITQLYTLHHYLVHKLHILMMILLGNGLVTQQYRDIRNQYNSVAKYMSQLLVFFVGGSITAVITEWSVDVKLVCT